MPVTMIIQILSRLDEFLRDVNVKDSILIFRELLSPSSSDPQDGPEMPIFFANMQVQRHRSVIEGGSAGLD